MKIVFARILLISISIFLFGCAGPLKYGVVGGTGSFIDTEELGKYKANQDSYLAYFAALAFSPIPNRIEPRKAGIASTSQLQPVSLTTFIPRHEAIRIPKNITGDKYWTRVTRAGWAYIDLKCSNFLREIYRRKKALSGLRRTNNAVGATTASVLGTTGAAAQAIALTAAAFSLTGNLFDIAGDTFLTSLEFNTISQLVSRTQLLYRGLYEAAGISSRTSAVSAIQGYIYLCEPSAIEANVNSQVQHGGDKLKFLINAGFIPISADKIATDVKEGIVSNTITGDNDNVKRLLELLDE